MSPDSSVVQRLVQHNLDVAFPHADDVDELHRIIVHELTVNVFTEDSKQFYVRAMQRLCDEHQVEGIVLGCTGEMGSLGCEGSRSSFLPRNSTARQTD